MVYHWRVFCGDFLYESGHTPGCNSEDNFQWAISQHQPVQFNCAVGVLSGDPEVCIRMNDCDLENISQWVIPQHQQVWLSYAIGVLPEDLEMYNGVIGCLQENNLQFGISQPPLGFLSYLINTTSKEVVEKMQLSMDHEVVETYNTIKSKLSLLMHGMRKVEQYLSPTVTQPIFGNASEWALGLCTLINWFFKFKYVFIEPGEQCQNACPYHQPCNLCLSVHLDTLITINLLHLCYTVFRRLNGPKSDLGSGSSISLFLPVSLNCYLNEDTVIQIICHYGGPNPPVAFRPVGKVEEGNINLHIKFESWIKKLHQGEVEESNLTLNRTNQAGQEFLELVISKRSWIYQQKKLVHVLWSNQNKQTQLLLEVSGLKVLINLSRKLKEVKNENMNERQGSSKNNADLEQTMGPKDNCVQQMEAKMNDVHTRVNKRLLLINDLKLLVGHGGLSSPGNLSSCYSLAFILGAAPAPGECVAGFYHLLVLRWQAKEELLIDASRWKGARGLVPWSTKTVDHFSACLNCIH